MNNKNKHINITVSIPFVLLPFKIKIVKLKQVFNTYNYALYNYLIFLIIEQKLEYRTYFI